MTHITNPQSLQAIPKALFAVTLAFGVFLLGTAQADKSVHYSGTGFENVRQSAQGSWQITEENGKFYVDFADDFKVSRAPDLKIFFSTAEASLITNATALDQSVFVAKLTSFRGAARYEIPADVSINDFRTLLIHCEQFTKLWAATTLR